MQLYDELVKQARLCLQLAQKTLNKNEAQELRLLAYKYRAKAAQLNGGKLPFIEGLNQATDKVLDIE